MDDDIALGKDPEIQLRFLFCGKSNDKSKNHETRLTDHESRQAICTRRKKVNGFGESKRNEIQPKKKSNAATFRNDSSVTERPTFNYVTCADAGR